MSTADFLGGDLIYIGIGAAFAVVWEFYIGAFLGKFIPSNPFFGVGYMGRETYTLSGGEMQRVAIAGVLSMRPKLLILDEPTSNIDPEGTARVF